MSGVVEQALSLWGLEAATYRLIAARENAVYEVQTGQSRVALRVRRKGYRAEAEMRSELAWMAAVADGGVSVPAPVPATNGAYLCQVEGVFVDVLTWLTGATLKEALPDLAPDARCGVFHRLGEELARLHQISDAWQPPPDFVRAHWDQAGLVGPTPLWDRFWENPELSRADRDLCDTFRDTANARLTAISPTLDYGLIHADPVPDNVLLDGGALRLIDFDDGGFGYRLFDIATALVRHRMTEDAAELQAALIHGYCAIRPLDMADLDLFLALRSATYLGWNITRLQEPGGADRNKRFIATFRNAARDYLRHAR